MKKPSRRTLILMLILALAVGEFAADTDAPTQKLLSFSDVRGIGETVYFTPDEFSSDNLFTFMYNCNTVFGGSEDIAAQIMEDGKNPGLGIRALHSEGITGRGVNVGIIDQNIYLDHPEFSGKIIKYNDMGRNEAMSTMHNPAVASILVGESVGVAPGAKVYYAAAPNWNGDSEYYAKALYWIIEENGKLPQNEKIRVVTVSAAPSGYDTEFKKNLAKWDEAVLAAKNEGILVLDCRNNIETGFVTAIYLYHANPDDITRCQRGFPYYRYIMSWDGIGCPTSFRTVAEEYIEGQPSYQYGSGGIGWGVPYAAGVLALGWQVNPNLSNEEIVARLKETAYMSEGGVRVINPKAFIEAIKPKEKL